MRTTGIKGASWGLTSGGLHEATEPIKALHIANAGADPGSQLWRTHHDREALGPADRHIEAIRGQQEIKAAGGGVGITGGERMDRHRRLLALELIDRANPGLATKTPLEAVHLHVVGGGDQDLIAAQRSLLTASQLVGPAVQPLHQGGDVVHLLLAAGAVAAVLHRLEHQSLGLAIPVHLIGAVASSSLQLAFVEQF